MEQLKQALEEARVDARRFKRQMRLLVDHCSMEALDKANDDLRSYVPGETIDWDTGMIVVAIFRAMCAAAPKLEA